MKNDIVIYMRKCLDIQTINEYGQDALLEDSKNFTKNEVLNTLDSVLREMTDKGLI